MPRNVRESASDIEAEIRRKIREEAEVRAETKEQAEKVRDYARSISPVRTGTYAAAWKVEDRPRIIDGLPTFRVKNTDWKAHMIEYGTAEDPPESESPFGKDTPTPEFAVARKAAAKFGGTVG